MCTTNHRLGEPITRSFSTLTPATTPKFDSHCTDVHKTGTLLSSWHFDGFPSLPLPTALPSSCFCKFIGSCSFVLSRLSEITHTCQHAWNLSCHLWLLKVHLTSVNKRSNQQWSIIVSSLRSFFFPKLMWKRKWTKINRCSMERQPFYSLWALLDVNHMVQFTELQ